MQSMLRHRYSLLYAVLKQSSDTDPGTMQCPCQPHARRVKLFESFPKDYQVYFEYRGGDSKNNGSHFDRENDQIPMMTASNRLVILAMIATPLSDAISLTRQNVKGSPANTRGEETRV